MGAMKGRQIRQRTSNQEAEVKPWGPGAKADVPMADRAIENPMFGADLMEVVCHRDNLRAALKRVRGNKGSPGLDGMTVGELGGYLRAHWPQLKEALLKGEYVPQPVRRVEIPKPGKKERRKLGIPCVVDRFIQQALLQVLQPILDPTFSEHSYGFRPGRSAYGAVLAARPYVQQGWRIVVDVDLEKFFDRVNHDILIGRLDKRIG